VHSPIIYICEDDLSLGNNIQALLQEEGYQASCFYEGESLDEAISLQLPDVLLLDIQLPGENGLALAKRYSEAIPGMRIIIMSVKNSNAMRHKGYDAGAMMYLPKPFEPLALLACLKGLFAHQQEEKIAILHFTSSTLSVGPVYAKLTNTELLMLRQLAMACGAVVEYFHIIEGLGLAQNEESKAGVEVMISRLRKKLELLKEYVDIRIKNKQKLGYFLVGKIVLK